MSGKTSTAGAPAIEVDRVLFWATVAVILAWGVPLLAFPQAAAEIIETVYEWIAREIGVFYQWAVLAAVVVLAVIAFSRYGAYRLGGEAASRDYSTFSWVSMLFCAGIGGGLVYWAPIEWAFYVDTPPFGLAPGSPEALEWAGAYGIFHWGVSAWALYAFGTVAIAYPYYQRKMPYLRLSTSLIGLFDRNFAERPLGRAVDFVFILAMIGGRPLLSVWPRRWWAPASAPCSASRKPSASISA